MRGEETRGEREPPQGTNGPHTNVLALALPDRPHHGLCIKTFVCGTIALRVLINHRLHNGQLESSCIWKVTAAGVTFVLRLNSIDYV